MDALLILDLECELQFFLVPSDSHWDWIYTLEGVDMQDATALQCDAASALNKACLSFERLDPVKDAARMRKPSRVLYVCFI